MKVDGVRATEKFYMALLRATGVGGRTDKTLEFFEEMKEIGLKPGVRSYNCAVGACGKVCQKPRSFPRFVTKLLNHTLEMP